MILSCPCFLSLCFDLTPSLLVWNVGLISTVHFFASLSSPITSSFCLLSFLSSLCLFLAFIIHLIPYSFPIIIHSGSFNPLSEPSSSHPYPFFHHCFLPPLPLSDIRLRVRAEYLEHESALRNSVSSDKRQPLERQFELFSQANSVLRARDLGSIVCDIKFTELDNLEAFWGDYLSGALLEALKGVFITDSLRMAAGTEGVRLLISVDQDDYEEGQRLLRARKRL